MVSGRPTTPRHKLHHRHHHRHHHHHHRHQYRLRRRRQPHPYHQYSLRFCRPSDLISEEQNRIDLRYIFSLIRILMHRPFPPAESWSPYFLQYACGMLAVMGTGWVAIWLSSWLFGWLGGNVVDWRAGWGWYKRDAKKMEGTDMSHPQG